MNKVKIGNEECMCVGCVNKLMERVIEYLEFKTEELRGYLSYLKSKNEDKVDTTNVKEEIFDVEDMIKDLIEFKEYNDEIIDKSIKD